MIVTDPIADMLTRIRNAGMVNHSQVAMPHSKTKAAIAGVLKEEGFIADFEVIPTTPQPTLRIGLKYTHDRPPRFVITGIKRASKPGRRLYVGKHEMPWVRSGLGVVVVSTSKGVVTGHQARKLGVGGEVLCYVW
jgi:small subunit ribosomal protein S8